MLIQHRQLGGKEYSVRKQGQSASQKFLSCALHSYPLSHLFFMHTDIIESPQSKCSSKAVKRYIVKDIENV